MNTRYKFTKSDVRMLKRAHIAIEDASLENLAADLSKVPPTGFVERENALRIELGKERWRADLAAEREQSLKQYYAERERKIFEWLDAACNKRDAHERNATWWMLGCWAMFLMLVVAIVWRGGAR